MPFDPPTFLGRLRSPLLEKLEHIDGQARGFARRENLSDPAVQLLRRGLAQHRDVAHALEHEAIGREVTVRGIEHRFLCPKVRTLGRPLALKLGGSVIGCWFVFALLGIRSPTSSFWAVWALR